MKKAEHVIINESEEQVWIFCPGCKTNHAFTIKHPNPIHPKWSWNKSEENPSFSPSLLVFKDDPDCRCHSFVTNGEIQFLDDCFHDLKGTTVTLPEYE